LLGAAGADIISRSCKEIICGSGQWCEKSRGPYGKISEQTILTASGRSIPVRVAVSPVIFKGRHHFLEYLIDVSELKRADERLVEANSRIESLNDSLLQAQQRVRDAEDANRAKSEFLTNMGHELRTPLNTIIGFTEMVLDRLFGDLTAQQEEYLGDVAQSGRHLLSLIGDILDLSRIEAGKTNLELTEVRLDELLPRSLFVVREKAAKHGIRLKTEIEGLPEAIQADSRALKQILYNLLSNALKFTQTGGTVTLRASMSNGGVIVSVEDTGIGLNSHDLQRVFLPFEPAGHGHDRGKGAGLGLALARRLVNMHGGELWAESEGIGKGAAFRFSLPAGPDTENLVLSSQEK